MNRPAKSIALACLLLILIGLPYLAPLFGIYIGLATRIIILGLGAISLNFLIGFTGVVSFGHAAFFGLGAYGTAMVLKYFVPSTPLAIILGILLGTLTGVLVGALIQQLRGIYFAVVTIAFGQIFYYIAMQWHTVTGGDDGLTNWSGSPIGIGSMKLHIFNNEVELYYFVLVIFILSIAIISFLLKSPFGRILLAIRENELRSSFLGVSVNRYIWVSFIISSLFMSVAGSLYALLNNFADPHALHWTMSGDFVMMIILGGIRSLWGPLLGALLFVGLQDIISSYTEHWMSIIGIIFMIIVLYFPRGILGSLSLRMKK